MDTCAFDKLFFMNVPHILERIFFSLHYESYKTCMHVNTKWSKLLKSDAYQKKAKSVFQNEILEDHQRLWTAARSGNYSCARQLLSYEMLDINYIYGGRGFLGICWRKTTFRKTTVLFEASWGGHMKVVSLLIDAGADIDKTDYQGWTALHIASLKGHKCVAQLLIDRGADINMTDIFGQTALHVAACWGRKSMVEFLLERGSRIDTYDTKGWTPLTEAVIQGKTSMVKMLLEKGARPKTSNENFLERVALNNGNMDIMKLLRQFRARSIQ